MTFDGLLPLYHQISGWGIPDAEQAITVVSPIPVRISLTVTVTIGDSRREARDRQKVSITETTKAKSKCLFIDCVALTKIG